MQATIQQKNELKQQNENLKREKIGIEHQLCYAKEEMEKYLTNTKKMHDEAVLSNDVLTKGNKELKEKNEQLINENEDLLSKRSSLIKLFHKEVKELQEKVIKSKSFERLFVRATAMIASLVRTNVHLYALTFTCMH
ncbi:hypothetical protein OS493_011393 [Desmophyllum pertusum]|uniref:Uncharacterized protein n=1 Tax=Desmophyllum pertusum TaxID=174260 RepID=A0A9W9YRR7_9CNID|nr:hypothetical protein OS493_011393 [Desmophyllum pertusum]